VRRTHPVTEIALHKFLYLISVLFRLYGDGSPGKQRPESKRTTFTHPLSQIPRYVTERTVFIQRNHCIP